MSVLDGFMDDLVVSLTSTTHLLEIPHAAMCSSMSLSMSLSQGPVVQIPPLSYQLCPKCHVDTEQISGGRDRGKFRCKTCKSVTEPWRDVSSPAALRIELVCACLERCVVDGLLPPSAGTPSALSHQCDDCKRALHGICAARVKGCHCDGSSSQTC